MRLPTDNEIDTAAQQLGIADDNGTCPPNRRAQVAKSLLLAVDEDRREASRSAGIAAVVADVVDVHRRLVAELEPAAAAAITAALAPEIYRTVHPERTPDDAGQPRLDKPR